MQPNDQYQPEPSGIDYLNHIAPPDQSTGFDKKSKIILVIAGVIGLMSIGMIAVMAVNYSNAGPSPMALVARLNKLEVISTKYNKNLRTIALSDANSSLMAVLTTANHSIEVPLQAYSIDRSNSKQAKEIAALDSSAEIEAKLDDAHLNSVLDKAYAREMAYQLEETLVMMERLESATRVQSMREFLAKTIADFENLRNQFAIASSS